MTDAFACLSDAFVITVDGHLQPGIGGYRLGAVALVMPDEASAQRWVERALTEFPGDTRPGLSVRRVGDPWEFMRQAAREGLCGIEGADETYPGQFMFMVRVDEASETLPTILAAITAKGWDTCLTRTGVSALPHAELLHWSRFDILDRISGEFGQRCPFREWEHGDPLYELRSQEAVPLLAEVALLGDWNSTDGAFAFFTSAEAARHYRDAHLGNGRNRLVLTGPSRSEPIQLMAALEPTPVSDLKDRLLALAELRPLAAWCVNPDGHREDSAYGRLVYDEHPLAVGGAGAPEQPSMAAVSGIWRLLPGNEFELVTPLAPWTGYDTIRWSGGQGLQLLPLDRSFAADATASSLGDGLTEVEAEDAVERLLGCESTEQFVESIWESSGKADAFGAYRVISWDSVTGEREAHPDCYPSFLLALKYLSLYEADEDRAWRTEGASSCNHIGLVGSADPQGEDLRGARFQRGLRRIALRVIRRRYSPTDSADLVALANATLRTIHVEYAGYPKDLLWASEAEQQEAILEDLSISFDEWNAWCAAAHLPIDAQGSQLAISRLGSDNWRRLEDRTRHFVATALLTLEKQGSAPQLDYAPICVEVVKGLEVELGALIARFKETQTGRRPVFARDESAEKSLSTFLCGGKPPTLGAYQHLLSKFRRGQSELKSSLQRFLDGLPNRAFLLGSELGTILTAAIHRYRNCGAHDSPISEETCRECVEALIGTPERPGAIPRLSQWQADCR